MTYLFGAVVGFVVAAVLVRRRHCRREAILLAMVRSQRAEMQARMSAIRAELDAETDETLEEHGLERSDVELLLALEECKVNAWGGRA